MFGNLSPQFIPVPQTGIRNNSPHIMLQDTLAHWAAFVRLVRSKLLCQFTAGLKSTKVYSFKNVSIQFS